MALTSEWIDGHREPKCLPDADYPDGKDIDISGAVGSTCHLDLEYPAPRCGIYVVTCDRCGQRVALTTAGRPDDPRSITIGCLLHA